MLCRTDRSIAGRRVDRRPDPRRASILDDLVIEALQPLAILQIAVQGQVFDTGYGAAAVRKVSLLDEALSAIARHEFDVIVLGSGLADVWPTAAYEQIAEVAGSTPVLVQADFVGPMARVKERQDREQDIVVATAKPSLLGRLILTAILRSRALAEEPGTQVS